MPSYLQRNNKPALAYHFTAPTSPNLPTIVFCGGYRSDMGGTKAVFLEKNAIENGYGYLRFDYSGHGESEGDFEECVISNWRDDARDIINHCIEKERKFILVGSSMGGWISLLISRMPEFENQIQALIGIAAAPDFTEDMHDKRLTKQQQQDLITKGIVYIPNDYSDTPYSFTRAFYEDGKNNLILPNPHKLPCPATFLQGTHDIDVPPKTAIDIKERFQLDEGAIIMIEKGDHRLSSPDQLNTIWRAVESLLR